MKLRFSLRHLLILTAIVGAFCVFAWWRWIRLGPIAGVWTSPNLIQCLCEGEHFALFSNGKLFLYDENHPPATYYGSYKKAPDNSYILHVLDDPNDKVILKPRTTKMSWYSVADDRTEYFTRLQETSELSHIINTHEVDYNLSE